MASPYLLATTVLNPHTSIDTILPNVGNYLEGSIWDLSTPSLPTWVTQLNQAPTHQIHAWMNRLTHDPWRGLRAIAQQPFNSSPPHAAYVPLTQGQQVTILSPPFWVWLDHSLLTGTYMVAVTTFCPIHYHHYARHTGPTQRLLQRLHNTCPHRRVLVRGRSHQRRHCNCHRQFIIAPRHTSCPARLRGAGRTGLHHLHGAVLHDLRTQGHTLLDVHTGVGG
jgi:hypothetical protein